MASIAHSRREPRGFADGETASAAESRTAPPVLEKLGEDPAYQAYWLLRVGFTAAPILFGLDKFTGVLVDWEQYLAPWIAELIPLGATDAMHAVGLVEILAGVAVAVRPRFGAALVAFWLGGIIVNLLTYPGYFDVALRDFGLMIGALALGRLAAKFEEPELDREASAAAALR